MTWSIPPDLQWFKLPDREIEHIQTLALTSAQILRGIVADRLEAIESGTYYDRGDFGNYLGTNSYYNPRKDNRATKFNLDRCTAYHLLWHLDKHIETKEVHHGTL